MLINSNAVDSYSQTATYRIFNRLNLDYPGLEKVKSACTINNYKNAEYELLEYYKNRTNRIADFVSALKTADLRQADENVKNIFEIKTIREDFGKKIDWTKVQIDKEWQFSLARMDWFLNFISVYKMTADEKYVSAWMNQIDSWIDLQIPGYPRTIDTGRRMENWVISYLTILNQLKSKSVTPEFNSRFLNSLAEQSEFIYQPENWRRYSNWGTFENSGLALVAALFPEFKESDKWLKEIFFRMRTQLKNSYYPDGLHLETAPSYHLHELVVWFNFIKLVESNRISDPWKPQEKLDAYKELILPKAKALMYLYSPLGVVPQISDSDVMNEREILKDIAEYWDDNELKYVATNGQSGKVPLFTSKTFEVSGYTTLRSGWGNSKVNYGKELYLLLDHGSNKPWHAHNDILNVVATAYGNQLLIDPGRFTYNEGKEREEFLATAAHNTITIDGKDQMRNGRGILLDNHSLSSSDYIIAGSNGYENVEQTRSIFFADKKYWVIIDRIRSSSEQKYEQYWHLSESAKEKVSVQKERKLVETPYFYLFTPQIKNCSVNEGQISYEYRTKIPAPVIKIGIDSQKSIVLPTIIFPFDSVPPKINVEFKIPSSEEKEYDTEELRIYGEDFTDYFIFNKKRKNINTSFINTDAEVLYLKTSPDGLIIYYAIINGTHLKFKNEEVISINGPPCDVEMKNSQTQLFNSCASEIVAAKANCKTMILNGESVPILEYSKSSVKYIRQGKVE